MKADINRELQNSLNKLLFLRNEKTLAQSLAEEKYNMKSGEFTDYVDGRSRIEDVENEFKLFIIADTIDQVLKTNHVKNGFTDIEINTYSHERLEDHKIKFPIRIDCVQVEDDQWIGKCDVNLLMELSNSQLIHYNENTQRALRRKIRGNNEVYQIAINRTAIDSIKQMLLDGDFVPNTLTLNMPQESTVYSYDSDRKQLVIDSLDYFDITDGYHRFRAISEIYRRNEAFNYNMELRITSFSEDKSRRFIFQEDQKTKMRRIDSDAMNTRALANNITKRVNDSSGIFGGMINMSDGMINFAEFAQCVQFFYKTKTIKSKTDQMRAAISITKDINSRIGGLMETSDYLINKNHLDFMDLMILFTCALECENPATNLEKAIKNKDKLNKQKFYTKTPRQSRVDEIKRVIMS